MARRRAAWGVAGGHAQPVSLTGFTQRRPGGAQLLSSGIHAAELFGELKARSVSARSVRNRLGCQPTRCWHAKARSSPPAASPARSSPLWLAWLDPVLAVALVRWRQPHGGSTEVSCCWQWLGCLPERWQSCRRVSGNRCRKRVLGANPSLKQRQGSLEGSPAGGHLAQLVQHDLEARSSLGDIGVIRPSRARKMARARWTSVGRSTCPTGGFFRDGRPVPW
jgi:hypothetical protein